MNCENCEQPHDGSYASGRFCCSKCARGFSTKSKRSEINKRVSTTLKRRSKTHLRNDDYGAGLTSKAKGNKTEVIIFCELVKAGFAVSLPFGDNQRYDLIVDDGKRLHKVQCKTARKYRGSVYTQTSSRAGGKGPKRSYLGEVDVIVTYCPETQKVYWIPMKDVGDNKTFGIRVDPLKKSTPVSKIRWAKPFELESQMKHL